MRERGLHFVGGRISGGERRVERAVDHARRTRQSPQSLLALRGSLRACRRRAVLLWRTARALSDGPQRHQCSDMHR